MVLHFLFISHDLAVIQHVSDEIGVMYLGRIVEKASVRDLYREAEASLHPRFAIGNSNSGSEHGNESESCWRVTFRHPWIHPAVVRFIPDARMRNRKMFDQGIGHI